MQKSATVIIRDIHLNRINRGQQQERSNQKDAMEAKAKDICKCGVKKSLRETKSSENRKSSHNTPYFPKISHKNQKFTQCKISKAGRKVNMVNNMKRRSSGELIRFLISECCTGEEEKTMKSFRNLAKEMLLKKDRLKQMRIFSVSYL